MRLHGNRDFALVVEALDAYGRSLIERAVYGPEETSGVNRGMARSVTEVLRTLGNAEETLSKMRSRE